MTAIAAPETPGIAAPAPMAKPATSFLNHSFTFIPFEYTKELDEIPELLLTVDCQYGERNVQKFDGKTVAIIDHHIAIPRSMIKRASDEETDDNDELELVEIRDNYGACATVVWDMLKAEGFEAWNADNFSE